MMPRLSFALARWRMLLPVGLLWSAAGLAAAQAPAPAAPPASQSYLQGRSPEQAESTLAPHAPRLTATKPEDVPLARLRVPQGFVVELWAHGMPGARMMARGDAGTIFVGTRAIGRVYAVNEKDGARQTRIVAQGLTQPNGVAFANGALYVAAVEKVLRFDGIERVPDVQPVDLTEKFKLPSDPRHGWKFLRFGPDGKLYVPVGSPCNICEPSAEYGQIRRYAPDGSGMEVVARGIRNSVGFDFHPRTGELYFTDNGRDWMGENGPEEELNHLSTPGEYFGFPYCHAGGIPDRDIVKPEPCKGVTLPIATLGAHAAALGMRFYTGTMFPEKYRGAIFIARHGSWNRETKNGFDVVVATPSTDGKTAVVEPFLTGLLDSAGNQFLGRPADVLQLPDGSLLISDELSGAIYRVTYPTKAAAGLEPERG